MMVRAWGIFKRKRKCQKGSPVQPSRKRADQWVLREFPPPFPFWESLQWLPLHRTLRGADHRLLSHSSSKHCSPASLECEADLLKSNATKGPHTQTAGGAWGWFCVFCSILAVNESLGQVLRYSMPMLLKYSISWCLWFCSGLLWLVYFLV